MLAWKVISIAFKLLTLLSNLGFFVEIRPFNLNYIHKPRIFPLIDIPKCIKWMKFVVLWIVCR